MQSPCLETILAAIEEILSCNSLENKLSNFWKAFIKMIVKRQKKQKKSSQKDESCDDKTSDKFTPSSSGLHKLNQTLSSPPYKSNNNIHNINLNQQPYATSMQYTYLIPVINLNSPNIYYQSNQVNFIGRSNSNSNELNTTPLNYYNPYYACNKSNMMTQNCGNQLYDTNLHGFNQVYYPEVISNSYIIQQPKPYSQFANLHQNLRTEVKSQPRYPHNRH